MFGLAKNLVFTAFIFGLGYLFGIREVRFYRISSSSAIPRAGASA